MREIVSGSVGEGDGADSEIVTYLCQSRQWHDSTQSFATRP